MAPEGATLNYTRDYLLEVEDKLASIGPQGSKEIDRDSPLFNPLFFGHFAHLPIEEYKEDYANTLMTDDKVYDAMAGDIYGQGKVLALGKYKHLKWSYHSFLYGMSAAIIVFTLQSIL